MPHEPQGPSRAARPRLPNRLPAPLRHPFPTAKRNAIRIQAREEDCIDMDRFQGKHPLVVHSTDLWQLLCGCGPHRHSLPLPRFFHWRSKRWRCAGWMYNSLELHLFARRGAGRTHFRFISCLAYSIKAGSTFHPSYRAPRWEAHREESLFAASFRLERNRGRCTS
jgi:hypothetical protein